MRLTSQLERETTHSHVDSDHVEVDNLYTTGPICLGCAGLAWEASLQLGEEGVLYTLKPID